MRLAICWAASAFLLPACFAGTVRVANGSSRSVGVSVYYFAGKSKSKDLIMRTSISPNASWSYEEPHRSDGEDAVRIFVFETISGVQYACVVARWSHASPADTVDIESISDAKPDDRYGVTVDSEESASLLQVLRFQEE